MVAHAKEQSWGHWATRLLPSNDWRINNSVAATERKVILVEKG
jgi:hypothetical protein